MWITVGLSGATERHEVSGQSAIPQAGTQFPVIPPSLTHADVIEMSPTRQRRRRTGVAVEVAGDP